MNQLLKQSTMQNYKMIHDNEKECAICCESIPAQNFYSVGKCSHRVCLKCCIAHIQAKIQSFTEVSCIDTKCNKRLSKQSQIYEHLSSETRNKYRKCQTSLIIQKNRHFKPCVREQCFGYITVKQTKQKNKKKGMLQEEQVQCSECYLKHCPYCYKLSHLEQRCQKSSLEEQQEGMMKNLNYRRCPNCEIWVQKKGGCQYLDCKCGCQFCYECGAQFKYDPCRKMVNGVMFDEQVRNKLRNLKLRTADSIMGKVLFPFKLILILVLFLLFTILLSVILLIIGIGIFLPLLFILSPGFLICIYAQTPLNQRQVILARVMTVLLYPLIGGLLVSIVVLMLISYPIMRILYPTRLYDSLDERLSWIVVVYLQTCSKIFQI